MAFTLRTWHHPVSSHWPIPVPALPIPSAVGVCTILHCQLVKMKVTSLSCVLLFSTPWTVAYQDPLSMGFSRQEYWCGLPLPSPGDLPDPGIEPGSLTLQADTLPSESPGKPLFHQNSTQKRTLESVHLYQFCLGNLWRKPSLNDHSSILSSSSQQVRNPLDY